ncbi:hypothetical protein CPG38_13670 [Malaciobacter marinus]|uniref:DNA-binding protein n=1 Tax=Malaciobacter marinus TaxID=505249 RepID=UPI000C06CA94|nr:DNA-binding protein [Malaciobacter marinus]PHO11317.1 hypothetical protein CPG38_13670 [Malaciobacter marinus]
MEKKLSIKEYANLKGISEVTVNKYIKNKLVKSIKEGNRRYILLDEEELKEISTNEPKEINNLDTISLIKSSYEEQIKLLQETNKRLVKENKRLTKELKALNIEVKGVYQQFIGEMKTILLPPAPKKKKSKK